MSDKRSERLRSIIAATVSDAAENAAPVTVTGSAMPAAPPELQVAAPPRKVADDVDDATPKAAPVVASSAEIHANDMRESAAENVSKLSRTSAPHLALRAPQRAVKAPKWEKANVTLEPRDLAILEQSDAQARAYGFRIRKGGNPSLFVRAGLRLLEELGERDPEAWIKRIAATTAIVADVQE